VERGLLVLLVWAIKPKRITSTDQHRFLTSALGFLSMSRMILVFTMELAVTGGICSRFGVMAENSSPCHQDIPNSGRYDKGTGLTYRIVSYRMAWHWIGLWCQKCRVASTQRRTTKIFTTPSPTLPQ